MVLWKGVYDRDLQIYHCLLCTDLEMGYGYVPQLPSLPIYHQCAAHEPAFSILEKFSIFSPVSGQIFSSQDAKFLNFRSQDPYFFKETRSLDPTFGNLRGTYPPKKSWVPPPPTRLWNLPYWFHNCTECVQKAHKSPCYVSWICLPPTLCFWAEYIETPKSSLF